MHSLAVQGNPLIAAGPVVADWLWPLLMLAGVVALGVIPTLLMRRRPDASAYAPARATANPAQAALLRETETMRQQMEDVRRRAAELIGTAQRLGIRMDERAQRLRELLVQADQRIDAMSRANLAPPPPSASSVRTSAAAHRATIGAQPATTGPSVAIMELERKPERDARTRAICDLADLGREPLAIARELHEQVGTVELILALRNI